MEVGFGEKKIQKNRSVDGRRFWEVNYVSGFMRKNRNFPFGKNPDPS
jgi:hypothetical protein